MTEEFEKQPKLEKSSIKAIIQQANQTKDNINKISKGEFFNGLSNKDLEDIKQYLKSLCTHVEYIKDHFKTLKAITKLDIENEKKKKKINNLKNETISLIHTKYSMISNYQDLQNSYKQVERQLLSLSSYENAYFQQSLSSFDDIINASKEDPQTLLKLTTLVHQNQVEHTQDSFRQCNELQNRIEKIIQSRFQSQIGSSTDLISVLNNDNQFIINDLKLVQQFATKSFPDSMKIYSVIELVYKNQFEHFFLKDFDEGKIISGEFEGLLKLTEWISQYEKEILSIGGNPLEFSHLKSQYMKYMPLYQDHIKELTSRVFINSYERDQILLSVENIDIFLNRNQDLIQLNFPIDCFLYLNKQIDILCKNFDVNQFIEWIRQLSQIFQETIIFREKESITKIVSDIKTEIENTYNSSNIKQKVNLEKNDRDYEEKRFQIYFNQQLVRIIIVLNAIDSCYKYSLETKGC